MAKKAQTNPEVQEACHRLNTISKPYVFTGSKSDENGNTIISVRVWARKKKTANAHRAVRYLKQIGLNGYHRSVEPGMIAAADIKIRYDIHQNTYTITDAKLQELVALQNIMEHSYTHAMFCRNTPEFAPVSYLEIRRAVANYINQHQK